MLLISLYFFYASAVGTFIFDARVGLFEHPPCEEARIFIHAMNEYLVKLIPKLVLSPPYYRYFKSPLIKRLAELTKIGRDTVNNKIKEKLKEFNTDFSAQGQKQFPGLTNKKYTNNQRINNSINLQNKYLLRIKQLNIFLGHYI